MFRVFSLPPVDIKVEIVQGEKVDFAKAVVCQIKAIV